MKRDNSVVEKSWKSKMYCNNTQLLDWFTEMYMYLKFSDEAITGPMTGPNIWQFHIVGYLQKRMYDSTWFAWYHHICMYYWGSQELWFLLTLFYTLGFTVQYCTYNPLHPHFCLHTETALTHYNNSIYPSFSVWVFTDQIVTPRYIIIQISVHILIHYIHSVLTSRSLIQFIWPLTTLRPITAINNITLMVLSKYEQLQVD